MEKKTALPKNVRQIGDIRGNKRIYLEDYVVTYIHKKEKQEEKESFLGVFLGEIQKEEGETRIFIRGLLNAAVDAQEEKTEACGEEQEEPVKEAEQQKKEEQETQKVPGAKKVLEECRDYFGEMEVIGCCVIGKYPVESMKILMDEVPQCRRLLYHRQDQEEHLYWTETGNYEEISGYFVFYEQNRNMQEYMAETFREKEEDREKIADQAIKVFREKIKKKDQMQAAGMMKLASSFFVVTVLIIGAIVVTRIGSIRDQSVSSQNTVENAGTSAADGGAAVENTDISVSGDGRTVDNTAVSVSGSSDTVENVDKSAAGQGEAVENPSMSVSGNRAVVEGTDTSASVNGTAVENPDMSAVGNGAIVEGTDPSTALNGAPVESTGLSVSEDGDAVENQGASVTDAAAASVGNENSGADIVSNDTAADEAVTAQSRQVKASYVIREGDTLADICQKYYGNLNKLQEICQENGIQDANKIMPGQKITLP